MIAVVKMDDQKLDIGFINNLLTNPAKWNSPQSDLPSCIHAELDRYMNSLQQRTIATQYDNKRIFIGEVQKHSRDNDLPLLWQSIWNVLVKNMQLEANSAHESFGLTDVLRRCLRLVTGKLIATNSDAALCEIYAFAKEEFLKRGSHAQYVSSLQIIEYIEKHCPHVIKNIEIQDKLQQAICDKLFAYRKEQHQRYGFFSRWYNYSFKADCVYQATLAAREAKVDDKFKGIFERYSSNHDFESKKVSGLGDVLQDILRSIIVEGIKNKNIGSLQSIHIYLQNKDDIPLVQELLKTIKDYSDTLSYGGDYHNALKDTVYKYEGRCSFGVRS